MGCLLPQCMLHDQVRLGLQLKRILRNRESINDALLKKLMDKAHQSIELRQSRGEHIPKISYPLLPVLERKDEIIEAISNNQVIIVSGETGSGKTTQIPKMCLESGLGVRAMIGCTQPRRVAAMSLSKRLAEEMDVTWGREVGCKMRFSNHCHPETYIKMMTDGILLSEIQSDPFLCEYDVVIVDEAHERTLNIDFLLGYLKELTRKRDDLKIIITSATIDTEAFSEAFGGAPILEVSGRSYPVEVRYQEMAQASEEQDDYTFAESSVETVSQILSETYAGDVLVFMPSERDIHKTIEVMSGRQWRGTEILPLYGRQTSAEQQRVFTTSQRRRVIVATNVAETSLTIPNIHFVVDTGMARISRYNSKTRTKRLPIEFISQSSANQRKGRCGRIARGVCYRLYSEKDFNELAPYTQPEIQRANLAEVILRMKAFRLGQIEAFPFINPPSSQAIRAGYLLLQELGALDEEQKLTRLGMELAQMALDPSLGRMVLQAREEGVLEEVIVIAAGLSVQDVRERPAEQRAAAESAHKEFVDSESDFITLLNIWKTWREAWQQLRTENQVRKFCRARFISFLRMREWNDLYEQLKDLISELRPGVSISIDRKISRRSSRRRKNSHDASGLSQAVRAGIHRSVLSGLVGHIAHRKNRNQYRAAGEREVMVFPGSSLFNKSKPPSGKGRKNVQDFESVESKAQPEWIVAGEIVETSRLFARTVAGINVAWVEEIAPHICLKTYHDAHWSDKKERVVVLERVRAHGLLIQERWIDYGKIDPKAATAIFIRQALVREDEYESIYDLEEDSPEGFRKRLKFIEHNRSLCRKLELWQTRNAQSSFVDVYQALSLFYSRWLESVSSIHDLNRILKEHHLQKDFLFATEKDLLGEHSHGYDSQMFPDEVQLSGYSVGASYAYAPGKEQDGVTFKIPLSLLPMVDKKELDWSVPGFRAARWEQFLEGLPRTLRRQLMPIREKASRLADVVRLDSGSGLEEAKDYILQEWGVEIPDNFWENPKFSDYLAPKIEVFNRKNKRVLTGIDLIYLQSKVKEHAEKENVKEWQKISEKWERYGLSDWPWEEVPESIVVKEDQEVPLLAFPGLDIEDGDVNLRLFRTSAERDKALPRGMAALAEKTMQKELSWVKRDLQKLASSNFSYSTLGTGEELAQSAYINLRNYIFLSEEKPCLTRRYFTNFLQEARRKLRESLPELTVLIEEILELRQQILVYPKQHGWLKKELNMLVSQKFLTYIPFGRLRHLPRYLRMLLIRAERAANDPTRDRKKSQHVEIWQKELDELLKKKDLSPKARNRLWNLFWMMQEFKVSCYAQELGTSEPVSDKRLKDAISEIKKLF